MHTFDPNSKIKDCPIGELMAALTEAINESNGLSFVSHEEIANLKAAIEAQLDTVGTAIKEIDRFAFFQANGRLPSEEDYE